MAAIAVEPRGDRILADVTRHQFIRKQGSDLICDSAVIVENLASCTCSVPWIMKATTAVQAKSAGQSRGKRNRHLRVSQLTGIHAPRQPDLTDDRLTLHQFRVLRPHGTSVESPCHTMTCKNVDMRQQNVAPPRPILAKTSEAVSVGTTLLPRAPRSDGISILSSLDLLTAGPR